MISRTFPNAIALDKSDEQTKAQSELEKYLVDQAQRIAPEPQGVFSEATHTIRQLKAAVAQLHREMGAVITKAAFGKVYSDLRKYMLAQALNFVQNVLDRAPRTYRWTEQQESRRITTSRADGNIWCSFFAFTNVYDANKFYSWLYKKSGRCTMAVVRRTRSADYPFEVKVWSIAPEVLKAAIRKDTPMQDLADKLKAEGVSLRQDIPGHFTVWTDAGKIGTVDQRCDEAQNSWWVNQRQISKLNLVTGDRLRHDTAESAALALAELCRIVAAADSAKADLWSS